MCFFSHPQLRLFAGLELTLRRLTVGEQPAVFNQYPENFPKCREQMKKYKSGRERAPPEAEKGAGSAGFRPGNLRQYHGFTGF
ncbi:hypothetical protein [Leisingera aquaemixtae]|jgi:hypothetical protein|uniref:hypothetical protein n=1 Tax=Leisingera aquaemixtae TaxID=1396826 RepID=UPI00142EA1BE|nr:hypothetical protein [Leisingera aquaemixtae]